MEILKDIARFIWTVLSIWQAYMTGGIVIALLGIYERVAKKTISLKTFIVGVIAFLLVAFFLAWRDQYHAAQQARAELKTKYTPQLRGEISEIAVAPAGERGQDSVVTLIEVTIKNLGAPSIADHFKLFVATLDGRKVEAIPLYYDSDMSIRFEQEGSTRGYSFKGADQIWKKAIFQSIPTNGAVPPPAWGSWLVRGIPQTEIWHPGTKFVLHFQDVTGTPVECEYVISNRPRTMFVRPEEIQRRRH